MSKVADLEKHFERAMTSREQEVFLDTLLANSELNLLDLGTPGIDVKFSSPFA